MHLTYPIGDGFLQDCKYDPACKCSSAAIAQHERKRAKASRPAGAAEKTVHAGTGRKGQQSKRQIDSPRASRAAGAKEGGSTTPATAMGPWLRGQTY